MKEYFKREELVRDGVFTCPFCGSELRVSEHYTDLLECLCCGAIFKDEGDYLRVYD